MKRLRTGDLRHLIDIEKQSELAGSYGNFSDTWSKLIQGVPCSVQTFGAKENIEGNVEQSTYTYKFRTRFNPTLERIKNSHRIIFKGRTLDIIHVENLNEMDVELIITAQERE